jgi:hypothetical protein
MDLKPNDAKILPFVQKKFDKQSTSGALCWLSAIGFFQLPKKSTG